MSRLIHEDNDYNNDRQLTYQEFKQDSEVEVNNDKSDDQVKAFIKNDIQYKSEAKIQKIEPDEVEIKSGLNFT